jgi:secondary thiamine-phosphate synthase enzyme
MQSRMLDVASGSREAVCDLTAECVAFLDEVAAGGDGLLHVFVPHATAGVAVLETGAGSDHDLIAVLQDVLPREFSWRHRHGTRGHGRDHVLPAFVAPYASIPVIGGAMALGTWQSVVLVDTNVDNRSRQVRLSYLSG